MQPSSTQTSYPIIGMSRSAIKHRLSPLSFLICIRRKLRLPIYPPNTRCTCGHHDHNVFGNHAFCSDKGSKKRTHNTIATDFATILSPIFAQAGYIYPNTKLWIFVLSSSGAMSYSTRDAWRLCSATWARQYLSKLKFLRSP